jgi:hypothetical protein
MERLEVKGRITEHGSLEVDLPPGLPPGDAIVTINLIHDPIVEDELGSPLTTEPRTGAEIIAAGVIGGWSEEEISDGQSWVDSRRRERRAQRAP